MVLPPPTGLLSRRRLEVRFTAKDRVAGSEQCILMTSWCQSAVRGPVEEEKPSWRSEYGLAYD